MLITFAGADLGFLDRRGGGGRVFKKKFEHFIFFWVDQIDFSISAKTLKNPNFGTIFCAAGKILAKTGQKRRF